MAVVVDHPSLAHLRGLDHRSIDPPGTPPHHRPLLSSPLLLCHRPLLFLSHRRAALCVCVVLVPLAPYRKKRAPGCGFSEIHFSCAPGVTNRNGVLGGCQEFTDFPAQPIFIRLGQNPWVPREKKEESDQFNYRISIRMSHDSHCCRAHTLQQESVPQVTILSSERYSAPVTPSLCARAMVNLLLPGKSRGHTMTLESTEPVAR